MFIDAKYDGEGEYGDYIINTDYILTMNYVEEYDAYDVYLINETCPFQITRESYNKIIEERNK